eukprot:COSAG02_NODE_2696_length_8213_cov_87.332388_4_plen_518_part_00
MNRVTLALAFLAAPGHAVEPCGYFAITSYDYAIADETAMLALMATKEAEMAAMPEILSASFVKTSSGVATPLDASCGADIPPVTEAAASCTGVATDPCATPDCTALAADETCTAAGCTLVAASVQADAITCTGTTPTTEADCPAGCTFAEAVAASPASGTIVARYADAASAASVADDVTTMLGDLGPFMVEGTMARAVGPVMWETDTETTTAGYFAMTTIQYADELDLLTYMDTQKSALSAIDGVTYIKAVKVDELTGTVVAGYTSAEAAAAAAAEVSAALANLVPYVTAPPERHVGPVIWSSPAKRQGYFAITAFEYPAADETAMLALLGDKEADMAAIEEILSAKMVKTSSGTTAADGITCTGTTPTQEADCPTGCTFAAAEAASCGGEATDACATPDCSALTADTACTDAGCTLTPSSDASCGADVDAVLDSNPSAVMVGAYASAAEAEAASAQVNPLLGELAATHMVPDTMERYTGPVMWESTSTYVASSSCSAMGEPSRLPWILQLVCCSVG